MKPCKPFVAGALCAVATSLAGLAQAQGTPSAEQPSSMQGEVLAQSATGTQGTGSAGTSSGYSTAGDNRFSVIPYTRNGYVGLNLGSSDYDLSCGVGPFCDDADLSGKLYVGGMFNRGFGMEFGYVNLGWTEREGGRTRAEGLNLSLVGRLPINGDSFAAFAKGGVTYGRTRVNASGASGVSTGREYGWGPSFGVGLSMAFSPRVTGVVEWERHRFDFAGGSDNWADLASVGVKVHF